MNEFSMDLLDKLSKAAIISSPTRPRLLLESGEVRTIRDRARTIPGFVDGVAGKARDAAEGDPFFHPKVEDSYLYRPFLNMLMPLLTATLVLDDERSAARALETVEAFFSLPSGQIPPPARRVDTYCHHSIPNTSALVGLALDICSEHWPADVVQSFSERISNDFLQTFLVAWQENKDFWTLPTYNFNWKLMCCGDSGFGALACRETVPNLSQVLEASLEGTLQVLDTIAPQGDWPEGPAYYLGTLRKGFAFGLALRRATGGAVDIFDHPALKNAGDFIMHLTEPDGGFFNFNDCPVTWPPESGYDAWGNMSLLANMSGRGEWARTARLRNHWSLERLLWDDPSLESTSPPEGDTARHFRWSGVATMRSGWDDDATFIGFKSAKQDVSHSQSDANSFVVSSRGERLLVDEGTWPYAALLGFFDYEGRRFNYDANGTIGHNSLMVDGQGQHPAGRGYGGEYSGEIVDFTAGTDVDIVVGDAAAAYGGRLERYRRSLAFVKPDLVLIYDQVRSTEPRYLEWLFHHDGEISGNEDLTTIKRGDASLTLARVLPEEIECWRMSDVERTSIYTDSDSLEMVRPRIRYRGFGPFHPCEAMDALWAVHVGDPEDRPRIGTSVDDKHLNVSITFTDGSRREVEIARTP